MSASDMFPFSTAFFLGEKLEVFSCKKGCVKGVVLDLFYKNYLS